MFFEHGVYLQRNSANIQQANSRQDRSCSICCTRGFRMDCDRCPIEVAHKETVSLFRSSRNTAVGVLAKGVL